HVRLDRQLLAQLAAQRLHQRLSLIDAAAGQQPVLLLRLLLTAQQDATLPAKHRADAQARVHQRPVDPKPAAPRSEPGSSSTSTGSTPGTGSTTSCAIRIPGSTTNASCPSVLRSATFSSPR